MNTNIKYFLGVVLLVASLHIAAAQEGTTYPTRKCYFPLDAASKTGTADFKDSKNANNLLPFAGLSWSNISDRNNNATGAMQVTSANVKKAMSQSSTINVTQNGFTVAFWTKFPPADATMDIFTIRANNLELWKLGITNDYTVYVTRYANKTSGTRNRWNLKFWEPAYANINRYISTTSGGSSKWFFIMLVQEKGQVRVHIGMPDGRFDCMYLDYGLDDQTEFINNITRTDRQFQILPSNSQTIYLDDLALWELPLCRAEAFEYFKNNFTPTPGNDKYPFNTSTVKDVVQTDDVARMNAVSRTPGGCLSAPPAALVAEPEAALQSTLATPSLVAAVAAPQHVVIYPNPATDRITISFGEAFSSSTAVEAQLYDMSGKLITQKQFTMEKGQQSLEWDNLQQARISTGLYALKLMADGKRYSTQIALTCGCGN